MDQCRFESEKSWESQRTEAKLQRIKQQLAITKEEAGELRRELRYLRQQNEDLAWSFEKAELIIQQHWRTLKTWGWPEEEIHFEDNYYPRASWT